MGKVGSTTVVDSLRAAGLERSVLPVHFLSEDLEKHQAVQARRTGRVVAPDHYLLGAALREALHRHPHAPCQIISLVRDPIAFVVSNLFEVPDPTVIDPRSVDGKIDPQQALQHLQHKFQRRAGTRYIDAWFDRELKRVFGIDVFAQPFPVDLGYACYQYGRARALVIRLEDLNNHGPQVLAEYLGLNEQLALVRSNTRQTSKDGEAYREVLKHLRLDEATCRDMYSCRIARHFYGPEMIDRFIRRWTHRG
jgi:hypothetical protein